MNFRDVIQNRRNDVTFNPSIGAFNVKTFLSFIQADAYEPLSVEAAILTIGDLNTCIEIATRAIGEADGHRAQREALAGILNSGPFRPGQLFMLMDEQNMELIISRQDFVDMVTAAAEAYPMATFESGYWADHWTYYMDLVENYLSIYPDWEERLMFDTELPYFFSPAFVKPRDRKYVLSVRFRGGGKHIRQLDATTEADKDKLKYKKHFLKNTTGWYDRIASWQHDAEGNVFKSSPISKLFLLASLKFATRDADGMGIEYEGGRPGWNDANNGLVGMLGSGMPETYELVVLLRYIESAMTRFGRPITMATELYDLVLAINDALDKLEVDLAGDSKVSNFLAGTVPQSRFSYWDAVASARESYRDKTKVTFCGKTATVEASTLVAILQRWMKEVASGIARATEYGTAGNQSVVPATYFYYNVTKWKITGRRNKDGHHLVKALGMKVGVLPLFLEGPARMMKTMDNEQAKRIHTAVKSSALRDEQLGMYTISESLEGQSFNLGREIAFAAGWLENQSIWMHMSYKFYLELLRHELFEDFFDEMITGMLPFIDPQVYGRSLMECSSFIASSAFEDPSVRGRGFLARLSGSTSEFLNMWILMMLGPQPFFIDERTGQVHMTLLPALPRWLFRENDDGSPPTISFKLFGSIAVTYYHELGLANLYRIPPSRYVIGLRDGSEFHVEGPIIPHELSDKIRRVVFVASVAVYFE